MMNCFFFPHFPMNIALFLTVHCFIFFSFFFPASFGIHSNSVKAVAQNAANGWATKHYDICESPLNLGNCTRNLTRFYYDSAKQRCFKFTYTGCNGNSNRFLTRNHCIRRCHPNFRHLNKSARLSAILQSDGQIERDHRQRNGCVTTANCANENGVCVNGICQCKSGYEKRGGDDRCIDSNECDWINCARNAKCVNLPGSFRCECRRGFAGSGFNCTKNRRVCAQSFDARYERQCQPEQRWVPRFYFHLATAECRQFWYGGCQFGNSQNIFQDKKSCASICDGYSHAEYFEHIAAHRNAQNVQQQKMADDPCRDPFDETLRQPCAEGIWKRRYYFDPTAGRCRVFWMDMSCPSPRAGGSRSRNIFVHVQNCQRACEREKEDDEVWRSPEWAEAWGLNSGRNRMTGFIQASFARSTTTSSSTTTATTTTTDLALAQMPLALINECALVRMSDQLALAKTAQEKRQRLARLKAKLGKVQRKNEQKQLLHNVVNKKGQSEACLDQFDWNLTKSCGKSRWRTRFFYDRRHGKCRPFWNDGCPGRTRNNFRDEDTCRMKCVREADDSAMARGLAPQEVRAVVEETLSSSSTICAQPFDDNYRRACNNGKSWQRKWHFDALNGFCRHFWYDGCTGKSRNIFEGLKQCMDMCVHENDFDNSLRMDRRQQQNIAYFGSAPSSVLIPHKNYLKSAEIWLNEKQCAGFRYNLTGSNASLSSFLCLLEEGGVCQKTVHLATDGDEKCHFGRPWLRGRHTYAWFFTLERRSRPSWTEDEASSASASLNETTPTTKLPPSTISAIADQSQPTESSQKVALSTDTAVLLEHSVDQQQQQQYIWTASAVLTLGQPHLNSSESMIVPIELFGRHNETVASVELFIAPIEQCNANTKC